MSLMVVLLPALLELGAGIGVVAGAGGTGGSSVDAAASLLSRSRLANGLQYVLGGSGSCFGHGGFEFIETSDRCINAAVALNLETDSAGMITVRLSRHIDLSMCTMTKSMVFDTAP